jgi:hypothetical protein
MFQQLARRALCLAGERNVSIWRTRHAQDAVTMHVEIEWIERDFALEPADGDYGHLAVEGNQVFVEQRRLAERLPGAIEIRWFAQHELPLAVVTHAPRLEHSGQADRFHREFQGFARIDRRVASGGDAK